MATKFYRWLVFWPATVDVMPANSLWIATYTRSSFWVGKIFMAIVQCWHLVIHWKVFPSYSHAWCTCTYIHIYIVQQFSIDSMVGKLKVYITKLIDTDLLAKYRKSGNFCCIKFLLEKFPCWKIFVGSDILRKYFNAKILQHRSR